MTTQLAPHRLDLPPPSQLDLLDMNRVVGWIDGSRVGFLGFADEQEAASAAWLAYRTVSRRLARRLGIRPIPIDTEPLALAQEENREVILASGRPIATLLRPSMHSRSGPHAFGFTVTLPGPADELTVRSTAHAIYRTLRKSGLRWALWAREPSAVPDKSPSRAKEAVMPHRKYASAVAAPQPAITVVAATVLAALALVTMVILFVTATAAVTVPIGVVLAMGALATTVLVVRERRRRHERRASNRPNVRRATAQPPDVPGWDELGILSAAVLVMAFLVPPPLGLGLLAVGLAGLLVFRIAVMYRR